MDTENKATKRPPITCPVCQGSGHQTERDIETDDCDMCQGTGLINLARLRALVRIIDDRIHVHPHYADPSKVSCNAPNQPLYNIKIGPGVVPLDKLLEAYADRVAVLETKIEELSGIRLNDKT